MRELGVTIHFLEPFRVIEWHDRKKRNGKRFMRGYSFARWHKSNESGRPYITGTLVRSAFLKAVEEILWIKSGDYKGEKCCPGRFKGSNAKVFNMESLNAKRLRRRQTLKWDVPICPDNSDNPCLHCLILGRFDNAKAGDKNNKENFHVKFSNFDAGFKGYVALEDIAEPRIINRVDQESGKAEDFVKIYEIDHEKCGLFKGKILISEKVCKQELVDLIKDAAALVDKIAGGLCRIEIDEPCESDEKFSVNPEKCKKEYFGGLAKKIAKGFETADKLVHLRLFADVVRELGRYGMKTLETLPKGHADQNGKISEHYIWDSIKINGKELRDWLKDQLKDSNMDLFAFCKNLGQALYLEAKKSAPESFPSERPLGAGEGVHISSDPHTGLVKVAGKNSLHEILITGDLVAKTPFFFGFTGGNDEYDHTSMRVLTTNKGKFRLPRSAIRGILRRDLKAAFQTGCRAELGHESPCVCPVCKLMRQITIRDSRSDSSLLPSIRHRIRINAPTGTVDEGALFDMETGHTGIKFPFELRIRSNNGKIPKKLKTVLSWWSKGRAFFSGGAGTGKGRFALENIKYHTWDLKDDFEDYKKSLGGRKDGFLPENSFEPEESSQYPWNPENLEFKVTTPFITKDPIASIIRQEGSDSVCYKAVHVDENGNKGEHYLLKGESFRGMLRAAIGRREKHLLTKEHEDCQCTLCRIFGNEHEAGKIRVEDLIIEKENGKKLIDRVAIDRFTGGARDRHKFDMLPLAATPESPLVFKGKIWISSHLSQGDKEKIRKALDEIKAGLYPFGGLGNIGFGWVNYPGDKSSCIDYKPLIVENLKKPVPEPDRIYWPHVFLPFGPGVKRENTPPSHEYLDNENYYTGKLVCTLETLTPLIIPDSESIKGDKDNPDHKNYAFFNINGTRCVQPSEMRGMISSVYEALTNSCLRIFDEKKRLSWRMEAKGLDKWKPGRVLFDKNWGLRIEEMEEMRLPVYDDPELLKDIKEKGKRGFYSNKKIRARNGRYINKQGQPTRADLLANQHAENIRNLLESNKLLLEGEASDKWFRCYPHGMDSMALLNEPYKGFNKKKSLWITQQAYIHFTGPNKLEKEKVTGKAWECSIPDNPLKIVHNKVSLETITVNSSKYGKVERKRAIPKYEAVEDNIKYTMNKRCERVFFPKYGQKNYFTVSSHEHDKFRQLCDEYENNADKIPQVFRTRLPKSNQLNHGDLVYFKPKNGEAVEIIPVRISRTVDDEVLAEKFPDNSDDRRPCVREILNDDHAKKIKNKGLKYLYQHHHEGLCPACALFGTGFYKSRVSFGFVFPENEVKLLNNGDYITLPLLERPRPTWSMPDKKAKIPGRKFYLHHQGWKKVVEKSQKGKEPKTANNRSVQAVDIGQKFRFEIKFENLRDWELGLLMYAVNLQTEPNMAHKLGMAKAFGFGSVKISIKSICVENGEPDFEKIEKAAEKKMEELWNGDMQKLENLFEVLCYVENSNIKVRYPALSKADDPEEKPGYMELKDKTDREKELKIVWNFWHKN